MLQAWRVAAVALACAVGGCGIVYQSAQVPAGGEGVTVVDLTAPVVAAANADPYVPRALPAVFSQGGGAAGAAPGGIALPPVTQIRPPRRGEPALIPPPPLPGGPYVIGVGDVVLLATAAPGTTVEELSGLLAAQNRRQGYTVQDDGAIAIPDVGRVRLAGLSVEEAEDAVFRALVAARIDPAFSLEVTGFNSQRVAVGGAVAEAVVVPVTITDLTLAEALARAGGVEGAAEGAVIRIFREGALYQVPVEGFGARPALQGIRLTGGDSVFVDAGYDAERARAFFAERIQLANLRTAARAQALDELEAGLALRRAARDEARGNFRAAEALDGAARDHVYLTGEVRTPSRFALPFGRQAVLNDALFGGGGGIAAATGDPARIYVLRDRDGDGRVTAFHLDARDATRLALASRFEMRPGDVVFVAEQAVTRWSRVVAQITPSLISTGVGLAGE
ncbi:polysaccharide export outer membrane protein [Hasllibacter halocynthiae]|uniref:Polysaccharide export outer membrane protein n=1 Tax=Hasllibacter halocynthiae TaxID=595589 RepID=A0A2T0X2H2_9RHOB|nr:polysaccharide biosynthesis/export family protein [Hasllibacter halocynthiae]PRY93152.1 polysaccharide export outer membrane protein [Hasllibacter halocynthiae]